MAGIALACAAYFFPWRRPPGPAQPGSGYVNSSLCAGCHRQIAQTYRLTGMGRSLYRPSPENTAPGSFYHRASDRYYTMLERGGKFYQRRHQIGFGGKETNVLEEEADYVVGSGNHARTYLHRSAEGKLVELPVSWYAEKGGYWAMSPGYDRADQQEFRRAIPDECVFCHDAYPLSEPAPDYSGGIDCQRCHGPGHSHIEAAGSGRAIPDSIRRAIVNPARLDRDRQLELCMQCHLETTSRPLPNGIRRYERGPFSYRPGEPLGGYSLYFDHAPGAGYDDKFEIAHAAYRLRKSACFQASRMTCTTCHNPHQVTHGQEAAASYAIVCRSCHAAAHASEVPARADCIGCHMPRRRAEDAVHVVMTDHYIQRRKPARDLLAPLQEVRDTSYRGAVTLYYPAQLPQNAESELYMAIAQVQQGANLDEGISRLRDGLARHPAERPEPYLELGNAYAKTGNPEEAIHWYSQALHRRADFLPALKELAAALSDLGRLAPAAGVLEKVVALPSPDAVVLATLGNVYLQQGQIERAETVLQQALRLNPEVSDAHNLLGLIRLRNGDGAGAEKHFREAISIQPDLAPGHSNLANLLAEAKDYAQAQFHFEKAIAANPAYAEAHYRYGLLLIVLRSHDRALTELREAVRLKPDLAQAHSDLADVLAATGRIDNAESEYRRALDLNPTLYEAHLALGQILSRRGKASEARAHFEKAAQSSDPDMRQAALKALR